MAQKNEAYIAAIRGHQGVFTIDGGLAMIPPAIVRKYRTDRWELTAPPSCAPIAAKDIPFPEPFPARYRIGYNGPEKWGIFSRD